MLKKIFCNRRILIITDDNIKNYPLTPKAQSLIIFSFLSFIIWVSFSSGKYFTFKQLISEKEAEVYQANLINLDLQTKIDSLQNNLVKLNEYFDTVKEFDYNQEDSANSLPSNKKTSLQIKDINQPFGASYAQKRVSAQKKENVLDNINSNTVARINNLKEIIAVTGLSIDNFNLPEKQDKQVIEKFLGYSNQGGPVTDNISSLDSVANDNADIPLNFSENLEELIFLESFFNSIPIGSPMKTYYISSRYGKRLDPITKKNTNHYGTDFAGPYAAKIFSTAPGVIKYAGRKGNYGNFVEIDHGFGIVTRYGHLNKVLVKKGDVINRGDAIATQGNTGRSKGHHLHYEVKFKDKYFNPEKFLKAGQYVF
ncbi:MAG: M23 family metallopeptidase [Rickettsiales bacterium]